MKVSTLMNKLEDYGADREVYILDWLITDEKVVLDIGEVELRDERVLLHIGDEVMEEDSE